MEILEFAIQMERDGAAFLRESAEAVRNAAARNMLLGLVQDEIRHEQILLSIKEGNPKMRLGKDFAGIKNVFQQVVDSKGRLFDEDDDASGILAKGIDLEQKSVQLYREMEAKANSGVEKDIYRRLRIEEGKHEKLLTLTREYVDKPQVVLENAEFLFYGHDEAP